MMAMIPKLSLDKEYKEKLDRSEALRNAAVIVKRERARSALQRAIEETLRNGLRTDEVQQEFTLTLGRASDR